MIRMSALVESSVSVTLCSRRSNAVVRAVRFALTVFSVVFSLGVLVEWAGLCRVLVCGVRAVGLIAECWGGRLGWVLQHARVCLRI